VRLAFRVGAVVRQASIGSQSSDISNLTWAVNVEGTCDEVVAQLETLQKEVVYLASRNRCLTMTEHPRNSEIVSRICDRQQVQSGRLSRQDQPGHGIICAVYIAHQLRIDFVWIMACKSFIRGRICG
jgi:hypothetical protein